MLGQAGEEANFDNLALFGVEFIKRAQRVFESDDLKASSVRGRHPFIQRADQDPAD